MNNENKLIGRGEEKKKDVSECEKWNVFGLPPLDFECEMIFLFSNFIFGFN